MGLWHQSYTAVVVWRFMWTRQTKPANQKLQKTKQHSDDSQAKTLLYLFFLLLSGWLELSLVNSMSTVHAWTSWRHT